MTPLQPRLEDLKVFVNQRKHTIPPARTEPALDPSSSMTSGSIQEASCSYGSTTAQWLSGSQQRDPEFDPWVLYAEFACSLCACVGFFWIVLFLPKDQKQEVMVDLRARKRTEFVWLNKGYNKPPQLTHFSVEEQ